LVRDAERQKMSKTKGNVIDPIVITEKYGTDAVRFTLAAMASPGTDIAFNEDRTEGYRAFANKIWNAARFIFMNIERTEAAKIWRLIDFQSRPVRERATPHGALTTLEDRWIFSRLNRVAQNLESALQSYRFHDAANEIYQFFWGEFCDWYIEIAKLRLIAGTDSSEAGKQQTRAAFENLLAVFETSLRLLSPFMPFLTEELWHALYDNHTPKKSIALASYPRADAALLSDAAEAEMAILQDLIVNIRNIRAELGVEPKQRVPARIFAGAEVQKSFEQNRTVIEKLANVEPIEFAPESLAKAPSARSTARFDVALVYEKKVDVAAERERLKKELARLETERANAERQLSNEGFLNKAPAPVVEGLRKRKAELDTLITKTRQALDELGN
jgi:valyl-tRNA synthetase